MQGDQGHWLGDTSARTAAGALGAGRQLLTEAAGDGRFEAPQCSPEPTGGRSLLGPVTWYGSISRRGHVRKTLQQLGID